MSQDNLVRPNLPIDNGGGGPTRPKPADEPATVALRLPAGRIVAGQPVTVTVVADPGATWFWVPADRAWDEAPKVVYTGTTLTSDGATLAADGRAGGSYTVTFPRPGTHLLVAACATRGGGPVTGTVNVRVGAPAPPAFTVTHPVDGTVVDLGEGGGQVQVQLDIPAGQYFPFTVTFARDGVTTTDVVAGPAYSRAVSLGPMPLGPRPVAITCTDPDGLATTRTVTVSTRDVAPPRLAVEFPTQSANVVGAADGTVTITAHGTVTDTQSGMAGGAAAVTWALSPGGARTAAKPVGGILAAWTADVPLSGFGAHTLHVWATDQAGNTTADPVAVPVSVISSYVPTTLDERLEEREYLAALLSFAQEQVTLPGPPPAPLDTAALVAVLGQPVDRLAQPLSAAADRGRREVNQLRVPVELLRARVAATNAPTGPGAAGESAYRSTAYDTLLAGIGTSYGELRLARGAADDVRATLASRLGIRLSETHPDELDQLLLDGDELTEAALETVFGLPSTVGDPLRAPAVPLLLTWRQAALALAWAEEDQHPSPPRAYELLLDPDVVGPADVADGPAADALRQLLAQRATLLADYGALLDDTRRTAASPAAGFAAIRGQALPGVDLDALADRDRHGEDIGPDLAAVGLSRNGFLALQTLQRLAGAGDLTPAEWRDTVAILTACHKHALRPDWSAQETPYLLSPDFFQPGGDAPAVDPFRADPRARDGWQALLRSRITQRQNLAAGMDGAVAAAEQAALPILRDALLAELAPGVAGDPGEELSALYLVDMLAGGALRTTRIRQAVESVQSLLSAKRAGELAASHPAVSWTLKDFDAFTAAWTWMGDFGSWQSATSAFLFPERHLDPTLLVPGTKSPLDTLFDSIRGSGAFGADQAVQAATTYLDAVKQKFTYLDPHRSAAHQIQLRDLSKQVAGPTAREIFWVVPMLLAQRLQSAGDFQAALDWYRLVLPYDVAAPVSIWDPLNAETTFRPDLTFPAGWTAKLDPFALVASRPAPYTRYTLLSIIRCHLDYADAEFGRETDESVATARTLYVVVRRLLAHPALVPQQPVNAGEPALEIPELSALRARAEVQLTKLRQGRNIAGMPRSQAPAGAGAVSQPTPYRYKVLLDRAKQLAAQAAQLEAGYLAALEKYDDRSLKLFDANTAVDLTGAQVALAASRVTEAADAVTAAVAQKTKADTMAASYGDLLAAPPNQYETALLQEYGQMRDLKDSISDADTVIGVAQAAASAADSWSALFSFGMKQVMAGVTTAGLVTKAVFTHQEDALEAQMQANQLQAGIEQRRTEWRVQQAAAQQDSLVAGAQVTVANDQVAIAQQERAVATLQHDQASATLRFLSGQFTNADLYLWMSGTLGGVYRYFLQQATATARLAQAQLAFERAEQAQTLIRTDYWQSPANNSAEIPPDRRGLTGAEQLGEDLARLDEYAVSTERRRLNLSQTFSLARLMPVEFLAFRRTGTLSFATPSSLFDGDFPGHYLRLIRQVRVGLVALVPPDRGIRATLYSNGISRVTTAQDGSFGDVVVRRDPTIVALTSPVNASGVFDLDVQSDMLLPFESSGVDTTWEFQLPPAANPLDFSSIADLVITIDYTAQYDDTLRSRTATRLNQDRDRGSDRVFSLVRDFPDQWYDLNNPADPAARTVTLPMRDIDFPLGVDDVTTAALAVRLVGPEADAVAITLTRAPIAGSGDASGGAATTAGGVAGTRRGNAPAWVELCGTSPVGDWTVAFGPDADDLFASGAVEDLLLVVSWTGRTPLWVP